MKRLFATLFALLAGTAAFAEQSETQGQWVPTHEFHVDLFGGVSTLNYTVDNNFLKTTRNFTDGLAGGAGFGYTWHINDWLGITTGAEFALYRSAFKVNDAAIGFTRMYHDPDYGIKVFSAVSWTDVEYLPDEWGVKNYSKFNNVEFSESQRVYSAQIPIMAQFMVPLNARKSNHFYAAVGARIGFNFLGEFSRTEVTSPGGRPVSLRRSIGNDIYSFSGAWVREADVHMQNETYDMGSAGYLDAQGNPIPVNTLSRTLNAALFSTNPLDGDWDQPVMEAKGKLNSLNLIQVLGSAEIGFRWGLGRGFGLYTGLYIDYGFMPMCKTADKPKVYDYTFTPAANPGDPGHHTPVIYAGSMLECVYDDPRIATSDGRWNWRMNDATENIAVSSALNNLGAGLKLKLAFGSVSGKKAEPTIQYVERIVRDTVKVVQRDTVVNTVIQKDTVVNTVIQHDTVTVVKEVPVEIQKVMADMSNSLFDTGKAIIKDDAKGPLYTVVMWLKANPDAKIEVSGHTDNVGGVAYNQKLSEARAKAVYEYFVSKGVNADRLTYAGYGMDRPIATNDTPEGREKNRRVELNVIE